MIQDFLAIRSFCYIQMINTFATFNRNHAVDQVAYQAELKRGRGKEQAEGLDNTGTMKGKSVQSEAQRREAHRGLGYLVRREVFGNGP